MTKFSTRGVLLVAALVTVMAFSAGSAQAAVTPVNAAVSATSTDTSLTYDGRTVNCARSDVTGTTSADGRAVSGRLSYTGCRAFGLFDVPVTCAGTVTLRSTSSVAGASISGTVSLDAGFQCVIDVRALGCRITIRGAQGPLTGFTFTAPNRLRVGVRPAATSSSSACGPASGTATYTGNYTVTPNLTVS